MAQRILYVEGKSDLHVVANICKRHDVVEFKIKYSDGVGKLLNDVPTVVKAELADADAIGMVVDADTSLVNRWKSISSRLVQIGYEGFPPSPEAGGLVMGPRADLHLPAVGVWVMPNNKDDGALEDFLASLVPRGNEDWGHAEACVRALGLCRFSPSDRKKAVLYTWLAWRDTHLVSRMEPPLEVGRSTFPPNPRYSLLDGYNNYSVTSRTNPDSQLRGIEHQPIRRLCTVGVALSSISAPAGVHVPF